MKTGKHSIKYSISCSTVQLFMEEDSVTVLSETHSAYNDDLKLECLYSVIKEYARFLRPAIFPDDTRFIFIATLCRLIDVSREKNTSTKESFDKWDLPALLAAQTTFFTVSNSAAVSGKSNTAERMTRLEKLILNNNYIQ